MNTVVDVEVACEDDMDTAAGVVRVRDFNVLSRAACRTEELSRFALGFREGANLDASAG